MKKLLTTLVASAILAGTASADVGAVEMGIGSWIQTPDARVSSDDSSTFLNLNGTYVSDEKKSSEIYLWMLIENPLPIMPNFRIEYVSVSDEGSTTGSVNGFGVIDGPTTIDVKQFDIIPYYNVFDTAELTIDLGLDIKVLYSEAFVEGLTTGSTSYSSKDTVIFPLLYLNSRYEIPSTDIGLEADFKFITDGTSTVYDIRAKVDYTLDFVPIVQPGLEFGYRIQKIDIENDETGMDIKFSGLYAGLTIRI